MGCEMLDWSDACDVPIDSSAVGSSVGWSPTVVTAGALIVAGFGAETVAWIRCFFLGWVSGRRVGGSLFLGLSLSGFGGTSIVDSIGKCVGLENSWWVERERIGFKGRAVSSGLGPGRIDKGRRFGSGLMII